MPPCPINRRNVFALALTILSVTFAQAQVRYGNSYVNVSKRSTGGTVQPGDTLEIRANYYFPNGYNGNNIYYVRYVDNIPTNTTYIGDSLRLITNEGLTFRRYTNAADADPATYLAAPPAGQFNIRINIGEGATAPTNNSATTPNGGGRLRPNSDRPRAGGGLLVTTAFWVQVTGNIGDTIELGAGQLLYKLTNSTVAADLVLPTTQYKLLITTNDPICPDAVGRNFVAEAGGTFDSGYTHNRSYGPDFLIPGYTYRPLYENEQTADGYYTIVNNLSPIRSTSVNSRKQPDCIAPPAVPAQDSCRNRMFNGHWDIIGDHTGTQDAAGNPPYDSNSTRPGGYMLVVNADYATSEAYRQTITGLCPNTSYEFSLWVRNVCTNCGIDSTGAQTWTPGVLPNLTFAINGLDRYSTGQIDVNGWQKKGFIFKTSPGQDSIVISIRNNASGGGGNDWAIDDIALVTCNPSLDMQPTGNANVCYANPVDMSTVVRSFFDNYTHWAWEMSTDGGATWQPTGVSGVGTPVFNNGSYEYTATYPTFLADSSQHLRQYRFLVGSSPETLADPNCSFENGTTIIVWVNNCQWILHTQLVSFTGKLVNGYARLQWTSADEEPNTYFVVERSDNGSNFFPIGTVAGKAAGSSGIYQFTDPVALTGTAWYRLRVTENANEQYSQTISISSTGKPGISSLVNPFQNQLSFHLTVPQNGNAMILLTDIHGRTVHQSRQPVHAGNNVMQISNLEKLPAGTYILKVQAGNEMLTRKAVKR
jgi:hypothetical protein